MKKRYIVAFLGIVTLFILSLIFFIPKQRYWIPPVFRIEIEKYRQLCKRYCSDLNNTFSSWEIRSISFTEWCKHKPFYPYSLSDCPTPDMCYVQKDAEHCDGKNSFSSLSGFPEKVRMNCSFRLQTGEFCNPDEIEDGWIKCCENPSLENCNCKKVQ